MSLVDVEVVMVADRPSGVASGGGAREKIEVLSPEGSFAVYHGKHFHCLVGSLTVTPHARVVCIQPGGP